LKPSGSAFKVRGLYYMGDIDFEWRRKGGALSDKTACEEFGLTEEEIALAVRTGKFQRREGALHGKPWVRLLRREVEELVAEKRGNGFLTECRAKAELKRINQELKQMKIQLAKLEVRKSKLMAAIRN
jgi:hypothetical protein